jgi:hypothetical protein
MTAEADICGGSGKLNKLDFLGGNAFGGNPGKREAEGGMEGHWGLALAKGMFLTGYGSVPPPFLPLPLALFLHIRRLPI